MRAAGLDPGTVRVGLAVADELGLLTHPRPHLDARNKRALWAALEALAEAEGIDVFVIGLPRSLDGREGRAAHKAREFAAAVAQHTGRRVELWDEWLTTREAQRRLQEGGSNAKSSRARIDSAAAALILQSWLDARARST